MLAHYLLLDAHLLGPATSTNDVCFYILMLRLIARVVGHRLAPAICWACTQSQQLAFVEGWKHSYPLGQGGRGALGCLHLSVAMRTSGSRSSMG
jgi:hypothetical protein